MTINVQTQLGKYGKPEYGHRCILPAGSEIIYDHEGTILPCGARLVIVSEEKPRLE